MDHKNTMGKITIKTTDIDNRIPRKKKKENNNYMKRNMPVGQGDSWGKENKNIR